MVKSFVVVGVLGATLGSLLPVAASKALPVAPATAPATAPAPVVEGAEAPAWFEARLELTGVKQGKGGDRAELRLDVDSHADFAARSAVVFEIRDDRGNLVAAKQQPKPFALAARGRAVLAFETPALPDGFYRAVVTAVAKGGETQMAVIPELAFESRGGTFVPLDFADFANRSAYNQGSSR